MTLKIHKIFTQKKCLNFHPPSKQKTLTLEICRFFTPRSSCQTNQTLAPVHLEKNHFLTSANLGAWSSSRVGTKNGHQQIGWKNHRYRLKKYTLLIQAAETNALLRWKFQPKLLRQKTPYFSLASTFTVELTTLIMLHTLANEWDSLKAVCFLKVLWAPYIQYIGGMFSKIMCLDQKRDNEPTTEFGTFSWQQLGPLLKVKLLVGYMRNRLCRVGTVNSRRQCVLEPQL